jgi:sulfur-oxidizing protein SoxA
MKKGIRLLLLLGFVAQVSADPESDRVAFLKFFEARFPDVEIAAHKDGSYALNEEKREQWLEMEDFPPYEFAVDDGETLFNGEFLNGKGYEDCFPEGVDGIKQNYPYFDIASGQVITLELAINNCREDNSEEALDYLSDEMGYLTAYMAFASRGKLFDIKVPPEGLPAYEKGKQFFYERRGQLDFACSGCHVDTAGGLLRAETLSAAVGHATHWPAYRFKWEQVGGLHKRFVECNEQVGAEGLAQQSESYRNLEYFLTYMNNGMELNGPGSRK